MIDHIHQTINKLDHCVHCGQPMIPRQPSQRHKQVLKILDRYHRLTTEQFAINLGIPKTVTTTLLHYMEERGMVRKIAVGRAGKNGYPAVWVTN